MKVKILIVPLLISIMIGIVIWLIAPDYFAMQDARKNLKAEQDKLRNIKEKSVKAASLKAELAQVSDQVDIVLKYVPPAKQEEEMINSLYSLATAEGLSVSKLSVMPEEKKFAPIPAVEPVEAGAALEAGLAAVPAKPVPENFQINMIVSGNYEKIRAFFNKLSKLRRFNNAASLKIAEAKTSRSGESPAPADALQAELFLDFKYFKKDNPAGVNADSNIFASGKFDMSAVSDIRSGMDTEILGIVIDSAGKNNPFSP